MTYKILSDIIKKHEIPHDVKLMSDSGWECGATEMNGIYYNKKENIIVFTQYINKYDNYHGEKEWVALVNCASEELL